MDFRTVALITLWTFLAGPVLGGGLRLPSPGDADPPSCAPAAPGVSGVGRVPVIG